MWALSLSRREFVDLISSRPGREVLGATKVDNFRLKTFRHDLMTAVWPAKPEEVGNMPSLLIVPEGTLTETLAWLITYVRDYQPFTAYCRVAEWPVAEAYFGGSHLPKIRGVEGIFSGLILGEALAHGKGRTSIFDLPATAYSATLSNVLARTYALTNGILSLDFVSQRWSIARRLTLQTKLSISPDDILSIWMIVLREVEKAIKGRSLSLFDFSDVRAEAWSDLVNIGEISNSAWFRLVEGVHEIEQMRSIVNLPREHRVQLVDIALMALMQSHKIDDSRRSFLAGYLASLISPGTLDHSDILTPVAAVLPTSYIWYGLFASINFHGDALPIGNPLARRIIRDLTLNDPIVAQPRCDVALEELEIYAKRDSLSIFTSNAERLAIDILPGVTMSVRWPPHGFADEEMRLAREYEIQRVLFEMEQLSSTWNSLAQRLRESFNTNETNRRKTTRKKRSQ